MDPDDDDDDDLHVFLAPSLESFSHTHECDGAAVSSPSDGIIFHTIINLLYRNNFRLGI